MFKTFDHVLRQLAWLLCLLPYKLAFSEKRFAGKVLLMFILQAVTESVPKTKPVREILQSKSV